MQRWEPSVWAFIGFAVVWAFCTAWLTDAAGWEPAAASAWSVLLLAAFGWARRGRDATDVVVPAAAVAYAAFAGLAAWRMTQSDTHIALWGYLAPLASYWPVALVGGLAYALTLAVFVALPASWLVRRHLDPAAVEADAGFAALYRELLAAHARPAAAPADPAPTPPAET